MPTLDRRRSGVLLHPTSLPGPHGIGDLGPGAYHFVDWLAAAGQSAWQVLPLTPIGPGNSPYASASAFAGSPLMVALEPLVDRGWLAPIGADEVAAFDARRVDFDRVLPWRMAKLNLAATGFFAHGSNADRSAFAAFSMREAAWLDDFALFMALDEAQRRGGDAKAWPQWDAALARREAPALADARRQYDAAVAFWKFVQWCFDTQWRALKAYANAKGVVLIGDLPIFVAHHSADCWARPDLYFLDADFAPTVVAGVPPDYFSATGQRWGNPLYDWRAMKRDGYAWWIARVRRQLELADWVRIDHFRGFAGYWEIPAACATAIEGRWVAGPGAALFEALKGAMGELPVIAEDLGVITADVLELRERFAFPGMRVLQFAFSEDATHYFLPHNYEPNCCVYTGTHDNDTAAGWWAHATERERAFARRYLDADTDMHWAMIRAAVGSVAQLAMLQMQDALGLDSSHRMNSPGLINCWTWRFTWDMVEPESAPRLAQLSAAYGRAPIALLDLPEAP